VSILVGLVVGGVGSIPGSVVFVLFVPNLAERVSTGLSGTIYGVILLLMIFQYAVRGGRLCSARRRAPSAAPEILTSAPEGGSK
jgi:branched-chain amino acid transport system permease protein